MKLQFVAGKPVTTTNFQSVQPLGVGGQLVIEQWEVLYQILKHEISPQCAGLLLEPVIDRQRGEIDWYLPSDAPPLINDTLPSDVLLKQAHLLIDQAKRLAQQMAQSADVMQKQKGALLEQALSYPSEDYIIATPYGPSIVAWGHQSNEVNEKDTVVAVKGADQRKKSMLILPPPILSRQEAGAFSYWPWLLGIVLLLLMIFLPWWQGLIPIQYCRYYWFGPLILLLILLPIIGLCVKNHLLSVKGK